ncbi:hypothetical protein HAX54_028243 [Datura stramonium]|uniref:Uncharacterized protein n=1 Tax=Datura stramonium TaxID=4076 RepID=A0ABS8V6L4_DATST|nr:hypothetical protein [Datura stramonium]
MITRHHIPNSEIVSDERDHYARILSLEVHPLVIGAFPLDREPPAEALHLIKWLLKENIDVLDSNKEVSVHDWVSFWFKGTKRYKEPPAQGVTTQTRKRAKPLSSTSKLSITHFVILDKTCKRKYPPSLFENNNGQISTEVLCKDETPIPLSVDKVVDSSGATSLMEGEVDQDHHWKRKNKMLGFEGSSTNMFNGIFDEDGATSPSCLEISFSPPLAALINEAKVAVTHIKSSKDYVPPSCFLPVAASNFEP